MRGLGICVLAARGEGRGVRNAAQMCDRQRLLADASPGWWLRRSWNVSFARASRGADGGMMVARGGRSG